MTPLQKHGREISAEFGLSKPMTSPMDFAAKRISCLLERLKRQIDTAKPVCRRILFSRGPLAPGDIWNTPEILVLVDLVLKLLSELELNQNEKAIINYLQKQMAETNKVVDIDRKVG